MRTIGSVMVEQGFSLDGSITRRKKGEVEWLPCSDEILKRVEAQSRKFIRRFQKPRIELLNEVKAEKGLKLEQKHTIGLIDGYFKRNHFIVDSQVEMMSEMLRNKPEIELGDEGFWEEEL